ncbi:MAG: hypothetical protein AAB914_04570 [Patescibacteria group bacterium]
MKIWKNGKIFLGVGVFLGVLASGFAGYYVGDSKANKIAKDPQIANSIDTKQEKNLYDGSSLTLSEMYSSLQGATGSDFDHRLLVYEIAIKQNETGMLRIAKEKSQQDQMKKYTYIQMEQNETITKMLYEWQRDWGFSHH